MFKNSSGGTTSRRRVVSLQSFEQFMVSFLWSIRVWTMENCRRSICFLQWHLFFVSCEVSRKLREATFFFFVVFRIFFFCIFAASGTNSLSEMSPHVLRFGSSLSMLRSKIVFMKNQNENNRPCLTCYVISMVFTLIDHGSRPFSARGFSQLL